MGKAGRRTEAGRQNASWVHAGCSAALEGSKYQAASYSVTATTHARQKPSSLMRHSRLHRLHSPSGWFRLERHWWQGEQNGDWTRSPQPRQPAHCPSEGRRFRLGATSVRWERPGPPRPGGPARHRPGRLTRSRREPLILGHRRLPGYRFGDEQVRDRALKSSADQVQVVQPYRYGCARPERGDFRHRRSEADFFERGHQVTGPPDASVGRRPPQVPLHDRPPVSMRSRCAARADERRLAISGSL